MVDWLPVICSCTDIGVSSIGTSVLCLFAVNNDNGYKRSKHDVGLVSDTVEREEVSKCRGKWEKECRGCLKMLKPADERRNSMKRRRQCENVFSVVPRLFVSILAAYMVPQK